MKKEKSKLLKILVIIYTIITLYFSFVINDTWRAIFCAILSILMLIINIFIMKNQNLEVHKKFGIVALVFGILMIFLIPVLHGIDEGAHFFKTYSSVKKNEKIYNQDKKLIDEVPKVIIDTDSVSNVYEEKNIFGRKINEKETIGTDKYIGAKLYSPISYITYLFPMFLFCNILNLDIYWIIILGRLFSFICWVLLSMYAIKIIPKKKEFIAFLCLMPINLTLVTTYTGDLVNNIVIVLFIAIWYRLYEEKRQIKISEVILISILGIVSACAKMVYTLIFLLIFLLPKENFKNTKHKIMIITSIIIIFITTFLININIVGNDLIESYPAIEQQKEFVKNNFFNYIIIFIRTIIVNFRMYLYQFTTGHTTMCHNEISFDSITSMFVWLILICSLFYEKSEIKFSKKQIKFILGIFITMISIIFLSLYLQWTATNYGIGYTYIMGVQGRYFMPIATLLILINKKLNLKIDNTILWNGIISVNFITLLKIIQCFL